MDIPLLDINQNNISKCRKFIILFISTFSIFLCWPLVGYQALLPVLTKEKMYNSLCEDKKVNFCKNQSFRLKLTFTLATTLGSLILSSSCL